MKLDVVIPCHKDGRGVLRLLESIVESDFSRVEEVIVVCNPPMTLALRPYPFAVRLLQSKTVGVNSARNLGWRSGNSPVVLFLDADCVISHSNFFMRHLKQHSLNPQVAAVGGPYKSDGVLTGVNRTYFLIQKLWFLSGQQWEGANWHLLGGNSSYKRDVLKKNEFDNSIVFGGAETELNFRLYKNGYLLRGFSDLAVAHAVQLTFYSFIRRAFLQGYRSGVLAITEDSEGLLTTELVETELQLQKCGFYSHCYSEVFKFAANAPSKNPFRVLGYVVKRIGQIIYGWLSRNEERLAVWRMRLMNRQ